MNEAKVNLGPLNGHSVGRILKEAVRRAATESAPSASPSRRM
jgi:hypothetical protein